MSFINRLLVRLGLRRESASFQYQQVEDFRDVISELAYQEQRPEEEVHADLLASALAQHNFSQELWQRWQSLTNREQDVAALICLGYTNGQIAARLGVSQTTVNTHNRHILSKFKMHGKGELRFALRGWDFRDWDRPPIGG